VAEALSIDVAVAEDGPGVALRVRSANGLEVSSRLSPERRARFSSAASARQMPGTGPHAEC
jgi:hypothetical protein